VTLKVNDLEKAVAFYENVFDFKRGPSSETSGYVSRELTDGETTLALVQYRDEQSPEAQVAGEGPGIQHWGLKSATLRRLPKPSSRWAAPFSQPPNPAS
jgi:catechol 2,3-dioxygenase-like lactoylglutathione lyase family enzyme